MMLGDDRMTYLSEMFALRDHAGHLYATCGDLADGVSDPALLAPTVALIRCGVTRMEQLIGDLLAYATAGDGAIHPQPVDLRAMVMVMTTIAERTDHLRAATGPGDTPVRFPDIATGPLPMVAICRRVVDRHHGSIQVTDNPGGGCIFTFTLPGPALSMPDTHAADLVPGIDSRRPH